MEALTASHYARHRESSSEQNDPPSWPHRVDTAVRDTDRQETNRDNIQYDKR